MRRFAYPNVAFGAFIGCGRYRASAQGSEADEILAQPDARNLADTLAAAVLLAPELTANMVPVYEKGDTDRNPEKIPLRGDSLLLAYFLASLHRAWPLREPFRALLGDIWGTGSIAKGALYQVIPDEFDVKLRAFLAVSNPDRVFLVPAANLTAVAYWCRDPPRLADAEPCEQASPLTLSGLAALLRQASRDAFSKKVVIGIQADELPLLAQLLFESPVSSPFQDLIDDKCRDFTGRAFVFDALDAFLETKDRGYFVIEGEPGIGKTSLMAYLVKTRGYVHYFNEAPRGTTHADQFLEGVCRQLLARYPWGRRYDPHRDFRDGRYLEALLEDIQPEQPNDRVIILVDALDEADTPPTSDLNWLYLPKHLPRGIYFVVTIRPLSARDRRLFVTCPQKNFLLDPEKSPEIWAKNLADIRDYIQRRVNREPLWTLLQARGEEVQAFAENLVRKSDGNFMYLYHVLADLESGAMRVDDELPQGLLEYYERHWRKMQSEHLATWVHLQLPVLGVLVAAEAPETVERIVTYIWKQPAQGADYTAEERRPQRSQVQAVLQQWRQFLRESGEAAKLRYRLYHRSFQEFLQHKGKAGEIDLRLAHEQIAEVQLPEVEAYLDMWGNNGD